jgi:hypothetical protein
MRLGELVADRGAERPREDVGDPACDDRTRLEHAVGKEHKRDRAPKINADFQ